MTSQIQDSNCRDVNARVGYGRRPEDLSQLKNIFDDNGIRNSIEEEKSLMDQSKYYDLKVSWCKSDIIDKIKDLIEGCTVPHDTTEAREIIARGGDHVTEVWEDGELTTTKGGELFRMRTLHRIGHPTKIDIIETSGMDDDHQSRIVKPDCGELVRDYTRLLYYIGEINNSVKSLMKAKNK